MTEYEWEAVCSLWGIRLTDAQRAAGCPDAFEPYELAIMQRPAVRTSPARAAELKSQRDILAKIDAAIAAGTLQASIQTRMVPITKPVMVENIAAPRSAWVTAPGHPPHPPMVQKTVKMGQRQEEYKVIERAAFRDWLNARGEPPSVHIQAWLRALDSAPATITKAKGQAAVVECLLQECATRAQRLGLEFNPNNMPGQKEQLFELIKRMEPSFKNMKSISSLERYLNGRCKWSLAAVANPDATTFYQKLFPEAWGNPGAVSENRKKA